MRIYDIIDKKRQGKELSHEEIEFVISGYMNGEIQDSDDVPKRARCTHPDSSWSL